MNAGRDFLYVDTPDRLAEICRHLRTHPWFALDTEFQREKTYFSQLCLAQVATGERVACIDPQALSDLGPFLDVVYDESILKVVHAGRQDLEIFFNITGRAPAPVFDTQIAAPLLGLPEQIGYAALVERYLDVRLAKVYTRADWTQRPLPADQIHYAVDDVRYLVQVYQRMHAELERRGRLAWLAEDFAALTDPKLYDLAPERAWQRIGGVERLNGAKLAVFQALAAWRETTAREENVPRSWVLRDETLLDIAMLLPANRDEVQRTRGISERSARRFADTIAAIIRKAKLERPEPLVSEKKTPRLTAEQDALVDALSALVRLHAEAQSLNAAVIASRKHLERVVLGEAELPLHHGWRASMIWPDIDAFLRGDIALKVDPESGKLAAQPYRRTQYHSAG